MTRAVRKHIWVLSLAVLLVLLLAVTKLIQPSFGASGLESVARAALPFAFATAGMAVVVSLIDLWQALEADTPMPQVDQMLRERFGALYMVGGHK